jgi:hypothetical protein
MSVGRTRLLLGLAGPPVVWAAHFIAVYAVISAACAPRGMLDPALSGLLVLALTAICLPLSLWPFWGSATRASEEMTRAIRWLSAISAAAILFDALPFVLVVGCS